MCETLLCPVCLSQDIPMLPSMLSEHLCSLIPGMERLTFSVVWTMNESGEVRLAVALRYRAVFRTDQSD